MNYDVIIIGGGIMGLATAYILSDFSLNILLIDQFPIINDFNASQDYSKAFWLGYASNKEYSKWAFASLEQWLLLEKKYNKKLFHQCGMIKFSSNPESPIIQNYHILHELGYPIAYLSNQELQKKYPYFSYDGYGIYEPMAGIIDSNEVTKLFIEVIQQKKITIKEKTFIKKIEKNIVELNDGAKLSAEKIVVTSGAWLPMLFPNIPIASFGLEVDFLATEEKIFDIDQFPLTAFMDYGLCLFPKFGIDAVKIYNVAHQYYLDMKQFKNNIERDNSIQQDRDFLNKHIPLLKSSTNIKTKICPIDQSSDGLFIIGHYNDSTIIAAGFCGHAYKFAPIISTILKDLILTNKSQEYDIQKYSLKRFDHG